MPEDEGVLADPNAPSREDESVLAHPKASYRKDESVLAADEASSVKEKIALPEDAIGGAKGVIGAAYGPLAEDQAAGRFWMSGGGILSPALRERITRLGALLRLPPESTDAKDAAAEIRALAEECLRMLPSLRDDAAVAAKLHPLVLEWDGITEPPPAMVNLAKECLESIGMAQLLESKEVRQKLNLD